MASCFLLPTGGPGWSRIAALALSLLVVPGLRAASTPSLPDTPQAPSLRRDLNPALLYWQAFAVLPQLTQEDLARLSGTVTNTHIAEGDRILAGNFATPSRLMIRAAGERSPCDWGIDFADGPATVMPNLARFRTLSQAALLRADVAWAEKRPGDALENLVAALVMGRHVAQGGALGQHVVQARAEGMWIRFVASRFHRFRTEDLRALLAALETAPASYSVSQAMTVERDGYLGWMQNRLRALRTERGSETEALAAWFAELGVGEESESDVELRRAVGGSTTKAGTLLRGVASAYDLAARVASAEDAAIDAAQDAFETHRRNAGNPFMGMVPAAVAGARARELDGTVQLAMLRAALKFRLDGEAGREAVKDPLGTGPFEFRQIENSDTPSGFMLTGTARASEASGAKGTRRQLFFVTRPAP